MNATTPDEPCVCGTEFPHDCLATDCTCAWSPLHGHATGCPCWRRPPTHLRGLTPTDTLNDPA